eukprot:365623-Chlamydomonas_euryale.AAC.11
MAERWAWQVPHGLQHAWLQPHKYATAAHTEGRCWREATKQLKGGHTGLGTKSSFQCASPLS